MIRKFFKKKIIFGNCSFLVNFIFVRYSKKIQMILITNKEKLTSLLKKTDFKKKMLSDFDNNN
jgi:hypothetical protein